MKNVPRWVLLFFLIVLGALHVRSPARAQVDSAPCTTFTQLAPDAGEPNAYTIPLQYGSFADLEIGTASRGTVQLEVDVIEQSVLKDRRIWILVPGRVVLLSEILGVENLFERGSPLIVRLESSEPVSAVLVRSD